MAQRVVHQLERKRRQESEGGSRGPAVRGRGRGEDGARVETWIRPSGPTANPSSHRGGSESSRDSEQDGELGNLSASDVRIPHSFFSYGAELVFRHLVISFKEELVSHSYIQGGSISLRLVPAMHS